MVLSFRLANAARPMKSTATSSAWRNLYTSAKTGAKAKSPIASSASASASTSTPTLAAPTSRSRQASEAFEASWPYRPPTHAGPSSSSSRLKKLPPVKASPSASSSSSSSISAPASASSSSPSPAGSLIEVRTVFARPLAFSPWRRILGATALAWFGVVWFQIPDKPTVEDWWARKDVGLFRRIAGSAFNTLYEHIPFIAIAGSMISIYRTGQTMRIITRLEQVRERSLNVKPIGNGKEGATNFYLLMTTGRSRLFLKFMRDEPRRVDLEEVVLEGTKYAKGPMVDFLIKPTTGKAKGADRRSYWLDLRDSPKHERIAEKKKEDYVISFNRLQHVFGRVDLLEK